MPKVGPDQTQVNFLLPKDLDRRVVKYQHRRELPSKSEAYRELIEKGLKAAEKEQEEAPE